MEEAGGTLNTYNDVTCRKHKKDSNHDQQYHRVKDFSLDDLKNVPTENLRNWIFEIVKNDSLGVFRLNVPCVSDKRP